MKGRLKAYLQFIFSLLIMALAIVFITKSNLGTSAVTSLPYVLSLIFPLTLGNFTLILNSLFYLLQLVILGNEFPKLWHLQIFVGPILGLFIDIWMGIISIDLNRSVLQYLLLILGCFLLAVSISIQLHLNFINNPAESLIKTISMKSKLSFSKVKVIFDSLLLVLASLTSYLLLGEIKGLGIGTIITAFLVGYFIKQIERIVT